MLVGPQICFDIEDSDAVLVLLVLLIFLVVNALVLALKPFEIEGVVWIIFAGLGVVKIEVIVAQVGRWFVVLSFVILLECLVEISH